MEIRIFNNNDINVYEDSAYLCQLVGKSVDGEKENGRERSIRNHVHAKEAIFTLGERE